MRTLPAPYQRAMQQLKAASKVMAFSPAKEDNLSGRTASVSELDSIQDTLTPSLRTELKEDGCYARAQILCEELRKRDISHGKLFAHSTYKMLGTGETRWNYHVAALALGDEHGDTDAYILDPTISPDPIKPVDWLQEFQRDGHVVVTLHDDRKYLNGLWGSKNFETNSEQARKDLMALK